MPAPSSGYFKGGLPYNRVGSGPKPLVVFQGLLLDNRPLSGMAARAMLGTFKLMGDDYTVYVVNRRVGLSPGCTLSDMAADYARMVKEEFGGPVDVIGLSTGGSIAQLYAAEHPDLLRRLILYSAACRLDGEGRRFQRREADLARQRKWGTIASESLSLMFLPRSGLGKIVTRPAAWAMGLFASRFGAPGNPTDFIVTVEAEDVFDFRPRLKEITAPTLVLGGGRDPFYPAELFRETAAGIPGAKLVLYPEARHAPGGKRVAREMLAFLRGA